MNAFKTGWFSETSPMWKGQSMSLEIEEVLEDFKSDYQHIQVFKSTHYGTVLVLDGVIQVTDRDEFAYQEMMTHVPMMAHSSPKKVCVIGGGDGGVVREILKYRTVEEVVWCEIDSGVIEIGKKYFPKFAKAHEDPRVKLHIGDGAAFLESKKNYFDVIITDSSDPIGPAATLFEKRFIDLEHEALREGGVIAFQCECIWLHLDIIERIVKDCKAIFKTVDYGMISIPTYPSGQIGVLVCSDLASVRKPVLSTEIFSEEDRRSLQYYNQDIHSACFSLPEFARKVIN